MSFRYLQAHLDLIYRDSVINGQTLRLEIFRKGTRFLGYYQNGYAFGRFWVGMMAGNPYGHLHGVIRNSDGTITGNNVSYIYPDMETSFTGKFEKRRDLTETMIDEKYAQILAIWCDNNVLPYVSEFSKPKSLPSPFIISILVI